MYYGRRRHYKEKKPKPTDLELLGYDRDKLISVVTKKNKNITCSRCSKVTDLSSLGLHAFHSGQYGIYYQCFECRKNLSIPVKIDLETDEELINIDKSISEFKKNLKELKKNFKFIKQKSLEENNKYTEKQMEVNQKESYYREEKRKLQSKLHKLIDKWEKYSGLGAGGFFSIVLKDLTGINPGYERIAYDSDIGSAIESGFVQVKNENVKEFKRLEKEIQGWQSKINVTGNLNPYSAGACPEGVDEKLYNVYIEWECQDPNEFKSLETIEDKYLKPLIAKKEKRILLLRKIFRVTNGSVYVLENDSLPDYYKIGWTDRSPEERAKELSGTGLPTPYRVAYSKSTNLTGEVEKEIHAKLDKFRPRSNREFFKVDLETIKKTILDTLKIKR